MAGTWTGPNHGYSKSILFLDVLTPCIGQNRIDFLRMKTDGLAGRKRTYQAILILQ